MQFDSDLIGALSIKIHAYIYSISILPVWANVKNIFNGFVNGQCIDVLIITLKTTELHLNIFKVIHQTLDISSTNI